MPDPYEFVRYVTMGLALVWSVRGAIRTQRFVTRWEARLDSWGVERRWLRGAVLVALARVTVLDPINLALGLALVGVWTLRPAL